MVLAERGRQLRRPPQLLKATLMPRAWLKTYVPAAVIGGLIGLAIGFAVHQLSGGNYSIIGYILEFHRGRDAVFWLFGGIFTAGAIAFLCAPNAK